MDLQSPFSLTAVFFFFFCYFLIKTSGRKSRNPSLRLPPGPWKLPFIGSLHHLASGSSPHVSLRALAKKHGPLMHLQLGQIPAVVVSSAPIAKEVTKTQDLTFASRPDLLTTKILFYNNVDIAFCPYGDYWRQMRKICIMELLGAKNVRSFSSIRSDEVSRLILHVNQAASRREIINISEIVSGFTTSVLCRAAFGNTFKYQDKLLLLLKEMVTFTGGFDVSDLFPSVKLLHSLIGTKGKLLKLHKKIDWMLENIIIEHGEKKGSNGKSNDVEDLIDVLLKIKNNGGLKFPLTHENIKALIWDIFSGGTDTSASVVEWAMSEIMRNPRILEKVQAEVRQTFKEGSKIIDENDVKNLSYLKMIIKETLRLHPPGPLLVPRESREDTKIEGYDISAKTKVMINFWAIARDPEYWHEPENFLPERFDGNSVDFTGNSFEFIPFGAGRRICPGMSFGLANVELPLAQLLYHFDWRLPGGIKPEELDMSETCGLTVARKNHLCLIATPYV